MPSWDDSTAGRTGFSTDAAFALGGDSDEQAERTNRLVLFGNGTSLNRGCQAIETTTLGILRRSIANPNFILAPMGVEPTETGLSSDCVRVPRGVWDARRYSVAWMAKNVALRIAPALAQRRLQSMRALDRYLSGSAALLQLGGDNLTLDYGSADPFLSVGSRALSAGCPVVIWGASVGPFSSSPAYEEFALRELGRASLIMAREQLTADYLTRVGLGSLVERVADPAFLLDPVAPKTSVVQAACLEHAVGFNISPLYAKYVSEAKRASWVNYIGDVVEALARPTDRPIVLVPHVVLPSENDWVLLDAVADEVRRRGLDRPIVLPPALNASEIKWCISRFDAFIGARTHSTIAALSSGIPTAVLAYSPKARGIMLDLLGDDSLVCPASSFSPDKASALLGMLLQRASELRARLNEVMPRTREMSESAGPLLADRLGLERPVKPAGSRS